MAWLVIDKASDDEISSLRTLFATFQDDQVLAHIDEYSETNIEFHQAILKLSLCEVAENLFIHMRSIQARTIADQDRTNRTMINHLHFIEALEKRDSDLAFQLMRQHSMNLARHIEEYLDYFE